MENKIWAYYINLSNHMWDDELSEPRGWYIDGAYTEKNGIDTPTWDEVVKYVAECGYNMLLVDVGDGMKYESRPEIAAPDAWDKDFLRKKIAEARALGLEVIPKLNFSCGHHTWLKKYRRMISTPEYYAAASDVIRECCEVFDNPRLFHLGMDEESASKPIHREMNIMRGERLWWHDCNFFFGEVEKYGARPWVWSDYYWHNTESFTKNMSRSVLQSNWFYARFKNYPEGDIANKRISSYEELDALGFDQVPCMSTCRGFDGAVDNCVQTLIHAKTKMADERVKGFLMAPWRNTIPLEVHYLKDAALRLADARRKIYPETL